MLGFFLTSYSNLVLDNWSVIAVYVVSNRKEKPYNNARLVNNDRLGTDEYFPNIFNATQ